MCIMKRGAGGFLCTNASRLIHCLHLMGYSLNFPCIRDEKSLATIDIVNMSLRLTVATVYLNYYGMAIRHILGRANYCQLPVDELHG